MVTTEIAHKVYDLLGVPRSDYLTHFGLDQPLIDTIKKNIARIVLEPGTTATEVGSDWSLNSWAIKSVDGIDTEFKPDPEGLIEFLTMLGPGVKGVAPVVSAAAPSIPGAARSTTPVVTKNRVMTRIPKDARVVVFISPGKDDYAGYKTTNSGSEWIFNEAIKVLPSNVAVIVTEDKTVPVADLINAGDSALSEANVRPETRILAGFSRGGNLVLKYIAERGSERFDLVLLLDPYIRDGFKLPYPMSNVTMIYNPRNWLNQDYGDMSGKFELVGAMIGSSIKTGQRHLEIASRGLVDYVGSKSSIISESGTVVPKWKAQEFDDHRGSWKVGDIYDYAKNITYPTPLNVKALADNNLEERPWETTTDANEKDFISRALDTNLDYPIIVVNYPDGVFIADGVHRLWKARELGYDTIMGYVIDFSALENIPQSAGTASRQKEI
jgi:hypothetical protein